MSTRKIKNARDLKTDELIYFKSHAQATFMSDGSTVEDTINDIKENGGADLSNYVTTAQLNTSLSGKQDTISDLVDIRSGASKGATAVQPGSLSTVATSGSYNDLSNKPTIASAVTINGNDKTISSGKINIGTIPTAVTINGSTKTGSTIALGTVVTGVKVNGSTKSPSSGTVDIGSVATTVKIDNVSKSPSSGTVDLGYINKRYSGITSSSVTLTPNIYYRNTSTSLSSFSFTLGSVSNSNIINEYFIEFTTSSSGTTVSLPSGIKWMNGVTPTFEASTTYQISIVNNLGTWVKFK